MNYLLECPFCGRKHIVEVKENTLLSSNDKIFELECASSFNNSGCGEKIIIMSRKTLDKIIKVY